MAVTSITRGGPIDEDQVIEGVESMLVGLGVETHEELAQTPRRVAALWRHTLLGGYDAEPATILAARLPTSGSAVVTLTGVPFHSVCPHHLVPYFGQVHLAYEPEGHIVGLGALERLVTALSRRLVLQETLCDALVDALMAHLDARGAACCVEAQHLCLMLRGREPRSTRLYTRASRGSLIGRPDVLPPTRGD